MALTALHYKQGLDFGQAVAEADRCLLCHDPPCSKGCPAGTDPGTFIRKFRLRNITGAIRTIKNNNIFGGSCGMLCPTGRLCERECSATGIERPVRIGKLQRFIVEYGYATDFRVFEKPAQKTQKVVIIGSGPAGLACAAELAKEGYQVTVFEKFSEPGGVMRFGVPPHRLDSQLLKREIEDITDLGVDIRVNSPIIDREEVEKFLERGYSAIFLAPGLWEAAPLSDQSLSIKGVISSIDFLKAIRESKIDEISALVKGKRVGVIGGGSVAIDCAESALLLGARDVYLIYRRSYTQMPAEEAEKVEALKGGIHFLLLTRPLDYIADSNGILKQVRLVRTGLGDLDSGGRRRPVDVPGSEWTLDLDASIEAIGQRAQSGSHEWYPRVRVDEKSLIITDRITGMTSHEKIFAGGDIVRGPSLIVEAVQDGKIAAKAIVERLVKEEGK